MQMLQLEEWTEQQITINNISVMTYAGNDK